MDRAGEWLDGKWRTSSALDAKNSWPATEKLGSRSQTTYVEGTVRQAAAGLHDPLVHAEDVLDNDHPREGPAASRTRVVGVDLVAAVASDTDGLAGQVALGHRVTPFAVQSGSAQTIARTQSSRRRMLLDTRDRRGQARCLHWGKMMRSRRGTPSPGGERFQ